MTSLIPNSTCTRCQFSPFCLEPEGNSSCQHSVNNVVKQYRMLKRKEMLYLPKNKFQNFYAIQHGAVKTFESDASGKEVIRGFYFAGEILGYESIYTGRQAFSAIALEETLICEIPYHHFLELLQDKPKLQEHILFLISQRISVGSYLNAINAEQRLAAFLLDLAIRFNSAEKKSGMCLPMSRQDIGCYLRLTAETVSRILTRFQKNKLITIDHKHLQLLQPDQLQQIADGLS